MSKSKLSQEQSAQESKRNSARSVGEPNAQSQGTQGATNFPPDWLGLEIDHRWLFEASQDGWLHSRSNGFVLGREFFATDPNRTEGENIVSIRLVVDEKKLPMFGKGSAMELPEQNPLCPQAQKREAFRWLANIPLYAAKKIEVGSREEMLRVRAMANQFSNVSLPDAEFVVGSSESFPVPKEPTDPTLAHLFELPRWLDSTQGAMAMAIWGVPHTEAWIDALQSGLNLDTASAKRKVSELQVPWLQFPWLIDREFRPKDNNSMLWEAAVAIMDKTRGVQSPSKLVERIAQRTARFDPSGEIQKWAQHSERLLWAEVALDLNTCESGLAIQLVLLRADPTNFKTWSSAFPSLSPATVWAGAMLCGWRHGYHALDRQFRGDAYLREFLTTRAIIGSWEDSTPELVQVEQTAPVECSQESGSFGLDWRKQPLLRVG